ncbi:maleylpyruvate isomerase N-terminal domain-containing protein [uncultured Cellulomonas sp.]|uniref:maleylpyruvate isomerase N-terminal domain-containing protein n=1 Tax=uncultured Cellulomonas sp. TaxID=189682 RepID=UPI002607D201|nr:maleylpyruvate isomerase N-terminal domain-containing protein [uncultured Cellulomonas sp.]
MTGSWRASRAAFADAAQWFVQVAGLVDGRWDAAGLGEWDVRALVGHTSRSLLTVEAYLADPATAVDVPSAPDYYRATRAIAAGPGVARRGRDAGAALGDDPAGAVRQIAARVVPLVHGSDPDALLTTIAGGMRLADYLPTRTFELVVHTADLAAALGVDADVPPSSARQALGLVADLAVADGTSVPLLLAATGRTGLPGGFSVL